MRAGHVAGVFMQIPGILRATSLGQHCALEFGIRRRSPVCLREGSVSPRPLCRSWELRRCAGIEPVPLPPDRCNGRGHGQI